MISANFLWGNMLLGGKLQIDEKFQFLKIFESTLSMISGSVSLIIVNIVNYFKLNIIFVIRGPALKAVLDTEADLPSIKKHHQSIS